MPNKELNNTVDNKWEEEFDKEVVDYFWNKKTTVGTQRLSINHIERIKQFIHKVIKQREDELKKEFKGMIPEKKKLYEAKNLTDVAFNCEIEGFNECRKQILNKLI